MALDLIASEQIRGASAMLGITDVELTATSRISAATIKRLEAEDELQPADARTLVSLQEALIDAGVVILCTQEQQPGVILKNYFEK